jgi:hypothetical protein
MMLNLVIQGFICIVENNPGKSLMLVHLHNSSFSFYCAMISFAMFNTTFIRQCPEGVGKEQENIAEGQTQMRKQKHYLHARISTQKCRRAKKFKTGRQKSAAWPGNKLRK